MLIFHVMGTLRNVDVKEWNGTELSMVMVTAQRRAGVCNDLKSQSGSEDEVVWSNKNVTKSSRT